MDRARILLSLTWAETNREKEFTMCHESDFINLNQGRDFLEEHTQYDVVILHHLFRGGFGVGPTHVDQPQLMYSRHSSWVTWRRRLVDTNAELIFVFGGFAEIGGTFIVNLDGYEAIEASHDFWVFKKVMVPA
jgi:hypothetical protein